jgi:hypothetical protein
MTWTNEEIDMLEQLKRVCVINMFVQSSSAQVCSLMHNILTVPNIFIGGLLSVSLFGYDQCSHGHGWIKIGSGIMAITSTILSSLVRQMSCTEQAQQHCFVVKEYHSIIRKINTNMALDNINKDVFIREMQSELDRLYLVQPEPSWFAVRQFENRFQDLDSMLYPEIERYAAGVTGRVSKLNSPTSINYNNAGVGASVGPGSGAEAGVRKLGKMGSSTKKFNIYDSRQSNAFDLFSTPRGITTPPGAIKISIDTTSPRNNSGSPIERTASWALGKTNIGYNGWGRHQLRAPRVSNEQGSILEDGGETPRLSPDTHTISTEHHGEKSDKLSL